MGYIDEEIQKLEYLLVEYQGRHENDTEKYGDINRVEEALQPFKIAKAQAEMIIEGIKKINNGRST